MALTPLPDDPFPSNSAFFAAYERCKALERSNTVVHNGPLLALRGRILGYMLIHAPIDEGRVNVRNEIESCETEANLMDLAQFYLDRFIRIFKSGRGRTHAASLHSSRPSFDFDQQLTQQYLEEVPKDHQNAKNQALVRDDYKCLVTKRLDADEYERRLAINPALDTHWTHTHAAHILPDCLNQDLGLASVETSPRVNKL
ncbi:hypothetical protein FRB93_002203 [Tulasnella sp. JGI-2019a]|nr:hypothetical protein FRB93_002203 [Tulasnella sp. JGI-2019a]